MKVKKILIIDDNDNFRAMLEDYLKMHNLGVEIFQASTGEMGITKAACIRPEIVLMDISLPSINGIDTTKQILLDYPDCQVIILTMFEVEVFRKAADQINAVDFIGKSEVFDRLLPSIKKCLAKNGNGRLKRG